MDSDSASDTTDPTELDLQAPAPSRRAAELARLLESREELSEAIVLSLRPHAEEERMIMMRIERTLPAAMRAISQELAPPPLPEMADMATCLHGRCRRTVLRFLARRLPVGADGEAIADDVMRNVFDRELLGRAIRAGRRFRDLLLAVTRYKLHHALRLARQRRSQARVALDDLGTLAPGTVEERREFATFCASQVVTAALDVSRPATTVSSAPATPAARCECPCPVCAALRERGVDCACSCGACDRLARQHSVP